MRGVFWVSNTGSITVYGQSGALLVLDNVQGPVPPEIRLEYDGGIPELRLYAAAEGQPPTLQANIPVGQEAIDFAVLEIDRGANNQSFVDNFVVRVTP